MIGAAPRSLETLVSHGVSPLLVARRWSVRAIWEGSRVDRYDKERIDGDRRGRGRRERLRRFLAVNLPGVSGAATNYAVCLYTMSPDERFIVDRHPTSKLVCFAVGGLSGNGFMFTPVLGEVLAEPALDGKNHLPYEFLRLDRFSGA